MLTSNKSNINKINSNSETPSILFKKKLNGEKNLLINVLENKGEKEILRCLREYNKKENIIPKGYYKTQTIINHCLKINIEKNRNSKKNVYSERLSEYLNKLWRSNTIKGGMVGIYDDPIGRGTYGSVYKLCVKETECDYAVKIFFTDSNDSPTNKKEKEKLISNEIEMQLRMNKLGIGPTIYYAIECSYDSERKVMFIMDLFDNSLGRINDDDDDSSYVNYKFSAEVLRDLINKVEKMHKEGYIHFDIFPRNIFVKLKKNGNGKKTKTVETATVGDFGLSIDKNKMKSILPRLRSAISYYHMAEFHEKYPFKRSFFRDFINSSTFTYTNSDKKDTEVAEMMKQNPQVIDYITLYNLSMVDDSDDYIKIRNELTRKIKKMLGKVEEKNNKNIK